MERRLTAILAADVAGYSRHTERNEEASTATLSVYRAVVEESIAAHKGHIFTRAGDGVVAEFPSVVEALRCAIEIQNEIGVRNASVPETERMQFRIGVNLGDVISEDNNCYGTGVNVAARLEQLAEPGGICISQTVYDQVRKIVEIPFQDIGERRLKNIADPVHVYRVLPAPLPWYHRLLSHSKVRLRRPEFAALIFSLDSSAVAGGASYYLRQPAVLWSTLLGEALNGNAIVVRPFEDKGDSPEQQTFSSGLTNDIITGLSRTLSVFEYQGKGHDIRDIGREFKARYVLEGSVSPSGGDLFYIRPKLTDAQSGKTVWRQHSIATWLSAPMSTTRSPVKSSPRSPAGMVLSRVAKPSRLQEGVPMTFKLTSLFRKRARKCSLNGNQNFLRMQESCCATRSNSIQIVCR